MSLEGNAESNLLLKGKLTKIPGIDKTLTKEGESAEAKATGDAIAKLRTEADEALNSHKSNKDNPHGVTPIQIGAHPNTWLPTPDDIGALSGTDTTLAVSGKAADAGAVGTALANKAPAGYGLGGSTTVVTDCNDAIKTGWYQLATGTLNTPDSTIFGYGVLEVINRKDFQVVQIAHSMYSMTNIMAIRTQFAWSSPGTWGAWEWINPPMDVGVEYKTTEKWSGRPVYTALIDCGNLPATEHADIIWKEGECVHILSCGVTYGNTQGTLGSLGYSAEVVNYNSIRIYKKGEHDYSNFTARAVIKYWKQ